MAKFDSNWWFGKNSLIGQISDDGSRDSSWWTGENSLWAQSGLKEMYTGAKGDGDGFWGDFAVPTEIDLSPDLKIGLMVVGGLLAFKIFMPK